jgi:hypothetical protein
MGIDVTLKCKSFQIKTNYLYVNMQIQNLVRLLNFNAKEKIPIGGNIRFLVTFIVELGCLPFTWMIPYGK